MNRRAFLGSIGFAGAGLSLSAVAGVAQGKEERGDSGIFLSPGYSTEKEFMRKFKEAKEFLSPRVDESKVWIVNFFSYTCPHCQKMSEYDRTGFWTRDPRFQFIRIPVIKDEQMEFFAHLYAWFISVNAPDVAHWLMFDSVRDKVFKRADPEEIEAFFVSKGFMKKGAITKEWDSIRVLSILRNLKEVNRIMNIEKTPQYVYQDRLFSDPEIAGGFLDCAIVTQYVASRLLSEKGFSVDIGTAT